MTRHSDERDASAIDTGMICMILETELGGRGVSIGCFIIV